MDQSEWPKRMAADIGQRIAFYRERLAMSAMQLAGRCADLGMPSISRVVITKLENGRREAVSTAELQVLAQALGVPPVLLLFPLGYAPEIEVLPGLHADPYSAIDWFNGYCEDPDDPSSPPQLGNTSPVMLWDEHIRCESEIGRMETHRVSALDPSQRPGGPADAGLTRKEFAGNIKVLARSLFRIRQTMRELGMTPPVLHPEIARILNEETPDGSR